MREVVEMLLYKVRKRNVYVHIKRFDDVTRVANTNTNCVYLRTIILCARKKGKIRRTRSHIPLSELPSTREDGFSCLSDNAPREREKERRTRTYRTE